MAAGLTVAVYARAVEVALGGGLGDPDALARCDGMVAGWFDLRDALRDKVRQAGRPGGAVVLAVELAHELTVTFGPPMNPDLAATAAPLAEVATTYRAVVNRLPEIASGIARAAVRWGATPVSPVIDPQERIPWRDHSGILRYARVAATELPPHVCEQIGRLAGALAEASAVAAADADRSVMVVGTQPHPHLARANAATAAALVPPTIRWGGLVASIDERVITDPSWPHLAHVLDNAASAGRRPAELLPPLARNLPDRQPALELVYRVREHCELQSKTVDDNSASLDQTPAIRVARIVPTPQSRYMYQTGDQRLTPAGPVGRR